MVDNLARMDGGWRYAVALGAMVLGACGGGGGSSGAGPTGFVDDRAAQTSAVGNYADTQRSAVFDRLNTVRREAGLGVLLQSSALDNAAQAHADYVSTNASAGQAETRGNPGFTGVDVEARAVSAGYAPATIIESTSSTPGSADGVALFGVMMGAPYHRMRLLAYAPSEVGIGYSAVAPANLVVDVAHDADNAQGAPNTEKTYWPRDGATGVPLTGCCEEPRPLGLLQWGYPVSVHVHERKVLSVISFTLRGPGGVVASTRLDPATDRALVETYGARNVAFLLPLLALEPDTVYEARFAGLVDGAAFERSWSFQTAAQ